MRQMASTATSAGAKGVFASGLDTDSLRRSLGVMATSVISTRAGLSSLAGGSVLRVGPASAAKVKRTDLVMETRRGNDDTLNSTLNS